MQLLLHLWGVYHPVVVESSVVGRVEALEIERFKSIPNLHVDETLQASHHSYFPLKSGQWNL